MERLPELLAATLDPAQRREAEAGLSALEPQLALPLLELVSMPHAPPATRLAAAIKLKNIARRAWSTEDDHEEDALVAKEARQAVKSQLVPLLAQLDVPTLRAQLSDCVAIIAARDFPAAWPELIEELVQALEMDPHNAALAALLGTSHAIFRRWRAEFRSDALYTEINYVLERFAKPFLELLKRTDRALTMVQDPAVLSATATAFTLQLQIFHDLSSQDLPPAIEDDLAQLLPLLLRHLNPTSATGLYSINPAAAQLEGDEDDTAPAPAQRARAEICSIVELYAQRYLDAFETHVAAFSQAVWEMLGVCKKSEKYDLLVARAISVLSTIVRMPSQRDTFAADATLEAFIAAIVLPNIALREADEEMFEDEPMEWVRREFAGESAGDDTRRRSATSFTRALLEQFGQQTTAIITRHVQQFLQEYAADKSKWRGKDTAIYLLSSIASTGGTASQGASSMNTLVDVVSFFGQHVYQDLEADPSTVHPILQVDAIKFLHTFRQQLTKEQLLGVLPLLVRHLESENYVTCSYAAIAIERVLFIKQDRHLLFLPADVQPFAEAILMALFRNIQRGQTPEKLAENDYLMKCTMRVILTCRETLAPMHQPILQSLTAILSEIARNPSNPRFSQFCFESIAALVRFVTAANPASVGEFEQSLSSPFMGILQNDVAEFVPYVFQVLSQMLELQPATAGQPLPAFYHELLPSLLTPALWRTRGNVPALVRLLQAFLTRAAARIVSENRVPAILGIYQQLIASRINDEFGFQLLLALFTHVPAAQLDAYKQAVLTLMLTRLQQSKTDKFARGFIEFVASLACIQKPEFPEYIVGAFDAVQPGLFPQIVQGIIIPDLPKVPQRQKRVVATGLARLLTESASMFHAPNVVVWPSLLTSVLKLLQDERVVGTTAGDAEEIFAQDWEEQGFQTSFNVLGASAAPKIDPAAFAGADPRAYLARQLTSASAAQSNMQELLASVPGDLLASLQPQ